MLRSFFSSNARVKLLKLFVLNPAERYYPRRIESLLHIPYTAIRRELNNLEKTGLLKIKLEANRKYYYVDRNFPIYNELKSMLLKTAGIGDKLKAELEDMRDIDSAFIYGSYARGTEKIGSDIDIFIIGNISPKKIGEVISDIESETAREINQYVFSPAEVKRKVKEKNHFIAAVFKEPKIFLKGSEDDIRKLAQPRQAR